MPNKPVIINNTPLVALFNLNQFQLLRDLYGEVWLPEAVQQEFLATDYVARLAMLTKSPWLKVIPIRNPQTIQTYPDLDMGEAEVLVLADEHTARLVIIDERKGRSLARQQGYLVTGTLGVLLLAKKHGLISVIRPLIEQLQAQGLYLAPALIQQVLVLAGEEQ